MLSKNLRSKLYIPILRETPLDAAIPSHQLLVRAGFMRRCSLGIYSILPLGERVLEKIEALIDAEMAAIDCSKVRLPVVQPAELWRTTGRWESTGAELMRMKDRRGDDLCLGPTHEEVVTDMVARDMQSYRDLPVRLYQVGTKFRDEVRPRFGLMRGREFTMKDAYTFDANRDDAVGTFHAMEGAYHALLGKMFDAQYVAVDADAGNIGSAGSLSREFQVLAAVGEDALLRCATCDYAANQEKASGAVAAGGEAGAEVDVVVLEAASDDDTDDVVAAVVVPAGREPNKLKLAGHVDDALADARAASDPRAALIAAAERGAALRVLIDANAGRTAAAQDAVLSCLRGDGSGDGGGDGGVAWVDAACASATVEGDFLLAEAGDGCATAGCGGQLAEHRGIEVGHVFLLGSKYADALGARFTDASGKSCPVEMGCFGLGVSRMMAALIEMEGGHDEHGIVWPEVVAPYRAIVVAAKKSLREGATALHATLRDVEDEVLLDDRWGERLGGKLKEAELIGYPFVIVLGRAWEQSGGTIVELQQRAAGRSIPSREVSVDELTALLGKQPII